MNDLFSSIKLSLKIYAITFFDLNALINESRINQCMYMSICVGTILFFALHGGEYESVLPR